MSGRKSDPPPGPPTLGSATAQAVARSREAELLGWLAGALDPAEAARLAGDLSASRRLRAQLAELRAQVAEPLYDDSADIRIATGAVQTCRVPVQGSYEIERYAGSSQYLGDDTDPPLVTLTIQPPDALDRMVVLLYRDGRRWNVLQPAEKDGITLLQDLPSQGELRVLELQPRARGRLRYAIALPRLGQADADWDASEGRRWTALWQAINEGEVPLLSLELPIP